MSDDERSTPIVAISPARSASDPKHPDHGSWVKDKTLAMEASHAHATGQSYRAAEQANLRHLQRMDGRKRYRRPIYGAASKAKAKNERRQDRIAERSTQGVFTRPVTDIVRVSASPCNKCGQCLNCRREARISAMAAKARLGDADMTWLMQQCAALTIALQKRVDAKIAPNPGARGHRVAFSLMTRAERDKAFAGALDSVCDWSVRLLGAWR